MVSKETEGNDLIGRVAKKNVPYKGTVNKVGSSLPTMPNLNKGKVRLSRRPL